jgi:hypothetical protein
LLLRILPVLFMSMGSSAQKKVTVKYLGPDDIVLDANMIRGEFGYTWTKINSDSDSISDRTAQLGNARCEFQIISAAMDKYMNFVVHDALYTDVGFGAVTSKTVGQDQPLSSLSKERRLSMAFKWGYNFNIGYRNKHWGLMVGIRPQWSMFSVGDFSSETNEGGLGVFSFEYPLSIRTEWRPFSHFEYRIVCSAWRSVLGGMQTSGLKIEIPTLPKSRYWLFAELRTNNYNYTYLSSTVIAAKKTTMFNIGVRFGSIF